MTRRSPGRDYYTVLELTTDAYKEKNYIPHCWRVLDDRVSISTEVPLEARATDA